MSRGSPAEIVEQAEEILRAIVEGGYCVAQEWDDRVDCLVRLANGQVVGEMIPFEDFSEERIRAAAERLRRRREGFEEPLVNELTPPFRIARNESD